MTAIQHNSQQSDEITALHAKVEELTQKIEGLENGWNTEALAEQLAASQAREQRLREFVEDVRSVAVDTSGPFDFISYADSLIALPHDTTALDRSNKLYAAGVLEKYIEIMVDAGCTTALHKAIQEAAQLRKGAGE